LATTIVAAAVILLTATFSFAEYAAGRRNQLPLLPTGLPDCRRIDFGFPETQI